MLAPETRTVTAGGETFELKPSKFALYWLLAERTRRGRPAVHWSEESFMSTLLHYYKRMETDPDDYERVEAAYQSGTGQHIINPAKAHINRHLQQRLG